MRQMASDENAKVVRLHADDDSSFGAEVYTWIQDKSHLKTKTLQQWGHRFIDSRRAIRPSGRHTLLSPSAVLVNNARQGLTKEWIALQPQVSQGWLLFRLGIPTLALFLSDPLHDPPSS